MGKHLAADADGVTHAVEVLRAGGLAALPTETVYGLAADASKAEAVAKIYATKHRPHCNPLIAHVASLKQARQLGVFNATAEKLASAFWPGPLTLVLPYDGGTAVCELARAGLDTIALRVPAHPTMQAVLREFGGVLVAPSANRSGHVTATSAEHVIEDFGDAIDLVLDAGAATLGLESTIVDVTAPMAALLRPGAIAAEAIESALGQKLARPDKDPQKPSAPGQLSAHYATHTPLRLDAADVKSKEALLAFGPPLLGARVTLNLSRTGDLNEAAANLFAHLRALDRLQARAIAVMPVPMRGLGIAINDRLRRAAMGSTPFRHPVPEQL